MIEPQLRYRPDFGEGWIRNSWPRPGMTQTSAVGQSLIGRFVADVDCWQFDPAKGNGSLRGLGDPLQALQQLLFGVKPTLSQAGAIGYVSYELGLAYLGLSPMLPRSTRQLPTMQFFLYEKLVHPIPVRGPIGQDNTHSYTRKALDALVDSEAITPAVSRMRYLADVGQIQDHIAAGDIYQANYTQSFELKTVLSPAENQRRLSERMRAPYSVNLDFSESSLTLANGNTRDYPAVAIMAESPERFWRKQGQFIDCRPIKGTIARGSSALGDRQQRRHLLESKKDRAELLMITDLMRNDLGQVADIGSVQTAALVRIRPTPSVWHLESTVTARLTDGMSWVDVMKALLPAGSISGTPKRRAAEILAELETALRGPYCGALGWVDANGDADFAVGIRTCVQIGNNIRIHGGGGIVADSDPESEYYESLLKIAPLIDTFSQPQISPVSTIAGLSDKSHA